MHSANAPDSSGQGLVIIQFSPVSGIAWGRDR